MEPFRIAVPDDVLDDLRRRLAATILPEKTPGPDWSNGIPPEVLGSLVGRWRDGYDWREAERRLNRFEQVRITVDGCDVHAVVARGRATGRLPIVVTHGWPYSFATMLPLVDALGGELDVVIPSLPGYGFSGVLPTAFSAAAVADRWNALMTSELGYRRYLTYGEDVGAGVSDWLAMKAIARNTAPTPHAALPSVKASARWNSRIIEKCLRAGAGEGVVMKKEEGKRTANGPHLNPSAGGFL